MNKILTIVILALLGGLFYVALSQTNKTSVKTKRVECQNRTITFEKLFTKRPVNQAIDLLESNNIEIKSEIEYSKYMKSNLINILTKEQSDEILNAVLKNFIKESKANDKKVSIEYYIYENDKEDKNKKNKKAKLYAGYLVFEFKLNNKTVYKIQTDYMNIDGKDIDERMTCVLESFTSLK